MTKLSIVHNATAVRLAPPGWRAVCSCNWSSRWCATEVAAQHLAALHARLNPSPTPEGDVA